MYLGGAPRGKQGGGLQLLPPALPQHPGSVSQSQTPARRQSQLRAGLGRGRRQTEMYGQLPPQATPKLSISRKLSPHPGPQSDVRHPLPPKKGPDIHLPIPGRLGFQDLGERWWWGGGSPTAEINQTPGPLQNLSFTINSSLSPKAWHLKASQTLMGTRSAAPPGPGRGGQATAEPSRSKCQAGLP